MIAHFAFHFIRMNALESPTRSPNAKEKRNADTWKLVMPLLVCIIMCNYVFEKYTKIPWNTRYGNGSQLWYTSEHPHSDEWFWILGCWSEVDLVFLCCFLESWPTSQYHPASYPHPAQHPSLKSMLLLSRGKSNNKTNFSNCFHG